MKLSGKQGETLAAWYLRCKGYQILQRNWRIRGGEIDIICSKNNELIFVEVKTRNSRWSGLPEETITQRKLLLLKNAIENYLYIHPTNLQPRVDVISINAQQTIPEITHIRNIDLDK